MERSFTIDSSEIGITGGRYIGKSPYTAAAKASRVLFREQKGKKTKIRFTLRETTRESTGKVFEYIGVKNTLASPLVLKDKNKNPILDKDGNPVMLKHTYSVKSCKL